MPYIISRSKSKPWKVKVNFEKAAPKGVLCWNTFEEAATELSRREKVAFEIEEVNRQIKDEMQARRDLEECRRLVNRTITVCAL